MSIITKIDSIPVFTTKEQALSWGRLNGYVGYREQIHFGKKGYIAGKTSRDIAFQKYPTQTATADLTFKFQQEAIMSTSYGGNTTTSYGEETSSGGYNGEGGGGAALTESPPPPQINPPPATGGRR